MAEKQSFIRPEEFWREVGLQAGQTVVHLGSGAGFYLIPAAKLVGASGKVIGVDLLPHLLEATEGRAQREGVAATVHTIRANVELPEGTGLPDASADWVLAANILHQSNPAATLAEAARIVKDNGHVVVVEWDAVATPLGPPVEVRISPAKVRQHAERVGLTVARQFRPSPYHYGLVLSKSKA